MSAARRYRRKQHNAARVTVLHSESREKCFRWHKTLKGLGHVSEQRVNTESRRSVLPLDGDSAVIDSVDRETRDRNFNQVHYELNLVTLIEAGIQNTTYAIGHAREFRFTFLNLKLILRNKRSSIKHEGTIRVFAKHSTCLLYFKIYHLGNRIGRSLIVQFYYVQSIQRCRLLSIGEASSMA